MMYFPFQAHILLNWNKIIPRISFPLNVLSFQEYIFFLCVCRYLPPYTSFMPVKQQAISENGQKCKNRRKSLVQCLLLSPLSILAIVVILICVSEREKLKKDPLNFNVLNITIEVVRYDRNFISFTANDDPNRLFLLYYQNL